MFERNNELRKTVRTKISEIYIEAQMHLRRVTNLELTVKDENGNLLADSHSILNRWKNYFCQLLNAHSINDAR